MCDVEIVTHCFRYGRSLSYQISGLILEPPQCTANLTVFCNEEDQRTLDVIKAFHPLLPPTVNITQWLLPKGELFRRAIGRNLACLHTVSTKCLILTDADYVYTGSAVDEIASISDSMETGCGFPKRYWKMLSHELGDEYLARQEHPQVLSLNPDDFEDTRIHKAIGGIMVVRSDVAKKFGYLDGTRWMEPSRSTHFQCCRCDAHCRGYLEGHGHPFVGFDGGMPWRIRHSRKGRDGHADIDN